jgi:GTP-binding protein Era
MAPTDSQFRSGFVTLVGRPNAGKSTLINAVMGRKLAITSDKVQTTRHRFRAVLTSPDYQLILVDTPGLHKPQDALGEELNRSAIQGLQDVDVAAFLLDATKGFGSGDEWVLRQLKSSSAKKLLVISKSKLATSEQIANQIAAAKCHLDFDDSVALSALEAYNVDAFTAACTRLLPPGPLWFSADTSTDQPLEVIVSEFIREKVLLNTFDEVPHAVGVQVDEIEFDEKKQLYRIFATIYVERESQKGIIVGKKGAMIKLIGSKARADLTHFLAAKVFLDLRVKLRKDWRRDANQIRRFGYGTVMQ